MVGMTASIPIPEVVGMAEKDFITIIMSIIEEKKAKCERDSRTEGSVHDLASNVK